MTGTHATSSGRKRLEAIANDYRTKGYEVIIGPRDDQLPRSLKGLVPDLLVRRGGEARVVEVKSRWARRDTPSLQVLAEAVEAEPGWALDVVLLEDDAEPWSMAEARRRLDEATRLLSEHRPEAALLLGWAALEAAIRLYARKERIGLERDDPAYLIKRLAHEGDLDPETLRKLHTALKQRNAVAHGHRAQPSEPADVGAVIEIAERLLQHAKPRTKPLEVE